MQGTSIILPTHAISKPWLQLAVTNALRYFPSHLHATLAPEFACELRDYGHIYMYRFRPAHLRLHAVHIDRLPARNRHCAAIMMMILNNLDAQVAQFPHELVWPDFPIILKQYVSTHTGDLRWHRTGVQ
jgi:hypothetical protein